MASFSLSSNISAIPYTHQPGTTLSVTALIVLFPETQNYCFNTPQNKISISVNIWVFKHMIAADSWDNIPWEFPGCWNALLARINHMMHYHDWLSLANYFLEETTELEQLPNPAHSSLEVHCSYMLKFLITWRIVLFPTAVCMAAVFLYHVKHGLLEGLNVHKV